MTFKAKCLRCMAGIQYFLNQLVNNTKYLETILGGISKHLPWPHTKNPIAKKHKIH